MGTADIVFVVHAGVGRPPARAGRPDPGPSGRGGRRQPTPDFGDFAYVAFVIGTTFATSDVTVTTRRLRWIVLAHSVTGSSTTPC